MLASGNEIVTKDMQEQTRNLQSLRNRYPGIDRLARHAEKYVSEHDAEAYICAWTANNVRVDDSAEKWQRRNKLQEETALQCNNLLALLSLAHSLFHLKSKRVAYWAKMTIETRGLIRKWHEADVKRYGKL